MPIFTTPISNQNTATAGGVKGYPQLSDLFAGCIIKDEFSRTTLMPSGSYTLYTTTAATSGTATIVAHKNLRLTTAATGNDYVTITTTGQCFPRASRSPDTDPRSTLTLEIIFNPTQATACKGFIGFTSSATALTALPTTAEHIGLFYDTTGTGNYMLSYANGSAQTTSDTGVAISTNIVDMQIIWNSATTATINFYNSSGTLVKSLSAVSFFADSFESPILQFISIATTTTAASLDIEEWSVKCT